MDSEIRDTGNTLHLTSLTARMLQRKRWGGAWLGAFRAGVVVYHRIGMHKQGTSCLDRQGTWKSDTGARLPLLLTERLGAATARSGTGTVSLTSKITFRWTCDLSFWDLKRCNCDGIPASGSSIYRRSRAFRGKCKRKCGVKLSFRVSCGSSPRLTARQICLVPFAPPCPTPSSTGAEG